MNDSTALGKHEVDMTVYAKVAAHEAQRQEGVMRLNSGFTEKLGIHRTPGVSARLDDDGRLQIDISVVAEYGADLRMMGPAIQNSVLSAIRGMSDQPLGQINVFVADIDFPKKQEQPEPAQSEPSQEEAES